MLDKKGRRPEHWPAEPGFSRQVTLMRGSPDGVPVAGAPQRFRHADMAQVPTGPGLYAWYGVVAAGRPDWALDIEDGVDLGTQRSRRLLSSQTGRYRGPTLEVSATGGFSTTWTGGIRDSSNGELVNVLSGVGANAPAQEQRAPQLQKTLEAPRLRQLLFETLDAAAPLLTAPIYIGVAKDLRARIRHHTRVLERLWMAVNRDPETLVRVRAKKGLKNEFGVRAIERGFTPETLEVWVLALRPLDRQSTGDDQQRTVAEAAEWLLNRWHRPPLGSR